MITYKDNYKGSITYIWAIEVMEDKPRERSWEDTLEVISSGPHMRQSLILAEELKERGILTLLVAHLFELSKERKSRKARSRAMH